MYIWVIHGSYSLIPHEEPVKKGFLKSIGVCVCCTWDLHSGKTIVGDHRSEQLSVSQHACEWRNRRSVIPCGSISKVFKVRNAI